MTAYSTYAAGSPSITTGDLAVKAGIYPIRINKCVINFYCSTSQVGGSATIVDFIRASSMSGGSSAPVVSLRSGSTAASATASKGSVTLGSPVTLETQAGGGGQGSSGGSIVFQPPLDLTLRPGEVFATDGLFYTVTSTLQFITYPVIYFEELRLDWAT